MNEMTVTRDIAATPERVWQVLTNLDGSPQTISGIDSVERLSGPAGFDVGTRWRETRTMFGRQATEDMEVTAIDPGRSYSVTADSHSTHYLSTMAVEPSGVGSRVTMTFAAEPQGRFSKLMTAAVGKLFQGSTRKAFEQDLADIAAAAEGGPAA